LALPILLAACSAGRVPNDELVVLIESPAASIDPRFAVGAYDFKIGRLVYAPLVSVDTPTLEPKMELAESVVPEGLDWVITLRQAQFSDGRPVTADDVLYTFEQLLDPRTGGAAARLRAGFKEAGLIDVKARSPKQLVVHMSKPLATLVTDLDFGVLARPRATTDEPMGAGPYKVERRDGETWHLVANPHYFGGPPRTRRVTFKRIADDNSRLLALVGGSGDLTQNTISPLLLDAVEAQPRLRVEHGRSSVFTYLGFNTEDPILKDPRVRRAIALAIDRQRIVHTKLRDRAVVATGMLPTFHWAYNGDVDRWDYDPPRARQLLDEAGYPERDGKRFSIIYKTSSNKLRVALARVIASMLGEVGIDVELRAFEWSTFFADVKKGNFQLFSMQLPEISEPDLYRTFFASSRIPTHENLDAGNNRTRYRNPEVDRLLDEGRETLDRDKRRAIYALVQQHLARDLPVVPLWHEDNVVAMRRQVMGFEILPTAQLSSLARAWKN
jgi:peptide/nickel transport system substrate-binding protein